MLIWRVGPRGGRRGSSPRNAEARSTGKDDGKGKGKGKSKVGRTKCGNLVTVIDDCDVVFRSQCTLKKLVGVNARRTIT